MLHSVSSELVQRPTAMLIAEAAIRVSLVYLLPIDVMVGVSTAMMVAVFAGLIVWNARWVARAQAR